MKKSMDLKRFAQQNRKNQTPEEALLWYNFLSKYPISFHRQYVVDRYILDFFCYKAMLAVELDGSQHYEPDGMIKDARRTEALEKLGIKVIRFSNSEVKQYFAPVCEVIDREVEARLSAADLKKAVAEF